MRAQLSLTLAAATLLGAGAARADHDMAVMATGDGPSYGLGVSMLAASYDTTYYVGTYQGVVPTARWSRGRWSATAMVGLYHIEENGLDAYGLGDVMVTGSSTIADGGGWRAGVTLAASAPTGNMDRGLGMGNAMVTPAAWATRRIGAVELGASAGYLRALGDLAGEEHGLWPLVEPMNMQEITWHARALVAVGRRLAIGVSGSGGVPVAVPMGVEHAIGAARIAWTQARMVTAFELQAGLVGDPFSIRGVIDTTVLF